jgi:hypothetical protein
LCGDLHARFVRGAVIDHRVGDCDNGTQFTVPAVHRGTSALLRIFSRMANTCGSDARKCRISLHFSSKPVVSTMLVVQCLDHSGRNNKGGLAMKKLIMAAAALTIAVATTPNFVGQSQAASAKNPYCDMAKNQRNTPSWNEHYGCLKPAERQALAHAPAPAKASDSGAKSTYCGMAKNQRNTPSWNEYYGCLR